MRIASCLLVLALGVLVAADAPDRAAPTSAPTTAPNPQSMTVAQAKAALKAAEDSAVAKHRASKEHLALEADLAAKDQSRKNLPADASIEVRQDALNVYSRARMAVLEADRAAVATSAEVSAAKEALVQSQAEEIAALQAAARAAADRDAKDPVFQGLKAGKLVKGMTEDQVKNVIIGKSYDYDEFSTTEHSDGSKSIEAGRLRRNVMLFNGQSERMRAAAFYDLEFDPHGKLIEFRIREVR